MRNIIQSYFFKQPQEALYHYTGIGALYDMCKAKKKEVWASSIGYMNDSKELYYALELFHGLLRESIDTSNDEGLDFLTTLKANLDECAETQSFLYVFSLSEDYNSLSQWRSYTPHGKGVCIEFNEEALQNLIDISGVTFAKCEYVEVKQKLILKELIEDLLIVFREFVKKHPDYEELKIEHFVMDVMDQIYLTLSIIKHPAFSDEREWRIIFSEIGVTVQPIQYRVGASMLTPYVALPLNLDHFMNSVRIGPASHESLSATALNGFLRSIGYPRYNFVKTSGIPYREW